MTSYFHKLDVLEVRICINNMNDFFYFLFMYKALSGFKEEKNKTYPIFTD